MIIKSFLRTIPMAAALFGMSMFSSPRSALAAGVEQVSSEYVSERAITAEMKELRGLMNQLNKDADKLNALTQSRLHWQTHAYHLTQVKEHVNRIGDRLEALQGMRSSAAPWQQDALDKMMPVALQVAGATNLALNHLNDDRHRLWAPEYHENLRTIAALSDHMHGIVDDHLKVVDAQDKLQNLEEKLAERVS